MIGDLRAETIRLTGHEGDEIEGYLAQPLGDGPFGAVVVIHHLPGYDAATKEIARTFAFHGYLALMPNLYWREGGPDVDPSDAAAAARANGGVPDERLLGDVAGAAAYLRALPTANGKVGSIGYCSGGRQSFLSSIGVDLQAAVDCYGAFVVGTPPDGFPLKVSGLEDRIPEVRCPVLGLFGADDAYPSPDQVAELDRLMTEAGKPHEFHSYEGAGHAFFSVDRTAYRPEAAVDGWQKIWAFFGEHL